MASPRRKAGLVMHASDVGFWVVEKLDKLRCIMSEALVIAANSSASAMEPGPLSVEGQVPVRAVPAPTAGEVKHTVALATLWASPSGRGWFEGWIGCVRACNQDG